MSYPNLPLLDQSRRTVDDGLEPSRASNGRLRLRRLYVADLSTFDLVHWLTPTQKATLDAAYAAYKNANVSLYWPEDGQTYTCRWVSAPKPRFEDGRWIVQVKLMEV